MRTRSAALLLSLLASLLIFPTAATAQSSPEACDAESIMAAMEDGPEQGTVDGMADAPVGTAASSNPVLTTVVVAISAAGLVDTLNAAEALTIFAPTDCAFAALDPATTEVALADPSGLLTTLLGFHVIAGERIASADLSGDYETFTGETITVNGTDVDGQASIVVPDIETANATVHLIDTVLLPPSVTASGQEGTEEPAEEATEEPADDDGEEPADDDAEAPAAEATDDPAAEGAEEATEAPAPTGGVAAGAGGAAGSSAPLIAMGVLALLALGGAVVARRKA